MVCGDTGHLTALCAAHNTRLLNLYYNVPNGVHAALRGRWFVAHLFISHSEKDVEFARHLRSLLQAEGFAVWMDDRTQPPTEAGWFRVARNIGSCAAFLLIMSPDAGDSPWVAREIATARSDDLNKPVYLILFRGRPWTQFSYRMVFDMTSGLSARLDPMLLEALKRHVPPQRPDSPRY